MKCANPQCRTEAGYFRNGSLHWIDDIDNAGNGRQRAVWLCAQCTVTCKVEVWRPAGEQLRPCTATESLQRKVVSINRRAAARQPKTDRIAV